MKYCRKCGKQISKYATFCPNCGFEQTHSSITDKEEATRLQDAMHSRIMQKNKQRQIVRCVIKSPCFIVGIILFLIGIFVMACSVNAINVYTGRSTLGIAAILYSTAIATLDLKPIIIGLMSSSISLFIGVTLIITSFIIQNKINKSYR